ncbi:dynein light chain Tctex-type 1-like [Panonychus citri]|uniref:dynein light chain Tctex-type 1-like n=1 Tax=Panonychus citri TaxID=50023 RepID=UPI002306EE44|nr:dynein light chain Tctex-type 1-like [Panonychus citri]
MDKTFDKNLVSEMTKDIIEKTIGSSSYQHNKVDQWTAAICDEIISSLVSREWPFKFIASCTIVQKNGAGFQSSTSCYWDQANDANCTVRWENKSMFSVTNIFAVSL